MSAADALFVKVIGRGGHGSAPHQAKDPVPVMAEMILGLQHMVTRQFNAHDPVVVSVGMVKAGEAINVIPDTAEFGASLRMYSDEARTKMQSAIPRLLKGIASAHGLEVDINYHVGGRVTVTDEDHTAFAADQITELFGAERHHRLRRTAGRLRRLCRRPGPDTGQLHLPGRHPACRRPGRSLQPFTPRHVR